MIKILTVAVAASMIAFSAFAEDAATTTIPAACSEDATKHNAKTVADLAGKEVSEACKAALEAVAPASH